MQEFLKILVNKARANQTPIEEIYLAIALVETGATDTPYFTGMNDNDLAESILNVLRDYIWKFNNMYDNPEWSEDNVFEYLSNTKEFRANRILLKTVYEITKEKGGIL